MQIIITLVVTFIIAYSLIFLLIYRTNKKEKRNERINIAFVLLVTFILALIPTAIIAFFLFALIGSTNIINTVFSLELSLNTLIILSIIFLLYLFTLDYIIELSIEILLGKNNAYYITLFFVRTFIFFIICALFQLNDRVSFLVALSMSLILICFDYISDRPDS